MISGCIVRLDMQYKDNRYPCSCSHTGRLSTFRVSHLANGNPRFDNTRIDVERRNQDVLLAMTRSRSVHLGNVIKQTESQ
jgi:hypothetical protein